jgi:surface antigen
MLTLSQTARYLVFAPSVGYTVQPNIGKAFRFESKAEHFALNLRKAGHMAWVEAISSDNEGVRT